MDGNEETDHGRETFRERVMRQRDGAECVSGNVLTSASHSYGSHDTRVSDAPVSIKRDQFETNDIDK